MDEEEGGIRLSKRFSDKGGEVDYKTKAGTAWSHSYLNQKPWHPLSYPNQRRKWIAEQTHAQRQRRADEVAREYAQEQEFFRQTALVSQKEKEKMEMMRAVSFMYVRPPGYNAESAKAAELAEEKKMQGQEQESSSHGPSETGGLGAMPSGEDKKKPRPKDVFGRAVPTEEQFEVLKNAPRLETGVAARSKPFGVEIRNVKCLRCGNFGHQSGDRECPLKDAIMPSEERRLRRDDPLTAIMAQTDINEPLKWELKQKPGLSPPRGGFRPDDPNQQIVAEDIFDEYGGFLGEDVIPDLLADLHSSKSKKPSRKRKHKRKLSPCGSYDPEIGSSSSDDTSQRLKNRREKKFTKKSPDNSDFDLQQDAREKKSTSRDNGSFLKKKKQRKKLSRHSEPSLQEADIGYDHRDDTSSSSDDKKRYSNKRSHKKKSRTSSYSSQSDNSDSDRHRKRSNGDDRKRKSSNKDRYKGKSKKSSYSSESESDSDYSDHDMARKPSYSSQFDYYDSDRHRRRSTGDDRKRKSSSKDRHKRKSKKSSYTSESESESDYYHDRHRNRGHGPKHSRWTTR